MSSESTAKAQEPGLAAQNEVVDKLKRGLDQMKGKLGELTAKRNQLVNRGRVAAAQSQVYDALKSLDAGDPTSAICRYEENIRRREATVRGQQELAASSLDGQFASLGDLGEQTEVEARLAPSSPWSGRPSTTKAHPRRHRITGSGPRNANMDPLHVQFRLDM
ncbi:phage shock protein A [Pseudarthrobacter sp. SLBN-100]